LQELANRCSAIMRVENIGTSLGGRNIWVIRASLVAQDNVPSILLAGNIHGDEVTGGQLLQRFAWDICEKYQTDADIRKILETSAVYIMPMFNADGYQAGRRTNNNGVDLNRNFPNRWSSPNDSPNGRQRESQHFMAYTANKDFSLSLMMHGGALVANYPYDSRQQNTRGYSATDRDALVTKISRDYSFAHESMWRSTQFTDGIVNGAVWYIIYGSLQDFMYDYRGCIDVTIEVSSVKWPPATQLPGFYTANYDSFLTYCNSVHEIAATRGKK